MLIDVSPSVRMRRPLTCLLAVIASACLAAGPPPKISKDLENATPGSPVDVIVQFRNGGTDTEIGKVVQKGGVKKKSLTAAKGASFTVPAMQLQAIASDPNVDFIAKDRPVQTMLDKATVTVGADLAWRVGQLGSGVGVAVIDSGIDSIDDLKGAGRDGNTSNRLQ